MRKEQIKNSFEVDGVEVFDTGDELVFFSKNEKGEEVEHHIAKVVPFPIGKDREPEKELQKVLRAAVNFPNLPPSKALEELDKKDKKK